MLPGVTPSQHVVRRLLHASGAGRRASIANRQPEPGRVRLHQPWTADAQHVRAHGQLADSITCWRCWWRRSTAQRIRHLADAAGAATVATEPKAAADAPNAGATGACVTSASFRVQARHVEAGPLASRPSDPTAGVNGLFGSFSIDPATQARAGQTDARPSPLRRPSVPGHPELDPATAHPVLGCSSRSSTATRRSRSRRPL